MTRRPIVEEVLNHTALSVAMTDCTLSDSSPLRWSTVARNAPKLSTIIIPFPRSEKDGLALRILSTAVGDIARIFCRVLGCAAAAEFLAAFAAVSFSCCLNPCKSLRIEIPQPVVVGPDPESARFVGRECLRLRHTVGRSGNQCPVVVEDNVV